MIKFPIRLLDCPLVDSGWVLVFAKRLGTTKNYAPKKKSPPPPPPPPPPPRPCPPPHHVLPRTTTKYTPQKDKEKKVTKTFSCGTAPF